MAIKSFKRYEKKYLLNQSQYDELIKRISEYMDADEHCKMVITIVFIIFIMILLIIKSLDIQ